MELRISYQIPAKTEPLPAGSTQLVKKVFDKLADGGASSSRHCHPDQFLLKSFGFPDAKTARKRFFALGNEIFRRFQSSRVRRTRRRARLEAQESFGHIELSEGFFNSLSHCLPAVLGFSKKSLTSRRTGEQAPPRHCHPDQFLLKSFGFPDAKTARKRFFALGNEIFRRFQSSRVRRTRRRARLKV